MEVITKLKPGYRFFGPLCISPTDIRTDRCSHAFLEGNLVCVFWCVLCCRWTVQDFLPRHATQSAVMRLHVVCPSVCLSVRPWRWGMFFTPVGILRK